MEDGFEEAAAFGSSDRELRLQPVAQIHQFIDLCNDALLLRERGNDHRKPLEFGGLDSLGGQTSRRFVQNRPERRTDQKEHEEIRMQGPVGSKACPVR